MGTGDHRGKFFGKVSVYMTWMKANSNESQSLGHTTFTMSMNTRSPSCCMTPRSLTTEESHQQEPSFKHHKPLEAFNLCTVQFSHHCKWNCARSCVLQCCWHPLSKTRVSNKSRTPVPSHIILCNIKIDEQRTNDSLSCSWANIQKQSAARPRLPFVLGSRRLFALLCFPIIVWMDFLFLFCIVWLLFMYFPYVFLLISRNIAVAKTKNQHKNRANHCFLGKPIRKQLRTWKHRSKNSQKMGHIERLKALLWPLNTNAVLLRWPDIPCCFPLAGEQLLSLSNLINILWSILNVPLAWSLLCCGLCWQATCSLYLGFNQWTVTCCSASLTTVVFSFFLWTCWFLSQTVQSVRLWFWLTMLFSFLFLSYTFVLFLYVPLCCFLFVIKNTIS